MIGFPENPEDGEVFQVNDDLSYQYSKSKKCWIRISSQKIMAATPQEPGLMSKDDFIKISNILLPVFNTTITGDTCTDVFEEGKVDLISSDDDIKIEHSLKMFNPDGVVEEHDFVIHNNTVGIDFRINMQRLEEELNSRGSIVRKSAIGPVGDRGDRGKPGQNNLDTGPVGDRGPDGANAPFLGDLFEDLNESLPTNRAVVDIRNDEEDPNKIIVVIGRIGSPGVGPKKVNWKNKNSQWVMGLSDPLFFCNVPQECQPFSNIIYQDVQPVLDKIEDKFGDALNKIKNEKEQAAKEFISTLSELFSAHRQALCCALESSVSAKVNQKVRNIMSNGRYQAAQAGYAFVVSSNSGDEYPRVPEKEPSDPYSFLPQRKERDSIPPNENIIINGNLSVNPIQFACGSCFVQVKLDNTNIGVNRSVSLNLPPGLYVATVIDCCMLYEGRGGSGVFTVMYNSELNTDIDERPEDCKKGIKSINDKGVFPRIEDRNIYTGESLTFKHEGGPVELFAKLVPSISASEGITICIQPHHCFQTGNALQDLNPVSCDLDFFIFGMYPGKLVSHELGLDPIPNVAIGYEFFTHSCRLDVYHPAIKDQNNLVASTGNVIGFGVLNFNYDDIETKGQQILVEVTTNDQSAEFNYVVACESQVPESKFVTSVISSHARWYQNSFMKNNACAARVVVSGQEYIVVYKNIGLDCGCGNGEYEETRFISDFKSNFRGIQPIQPALAWPTIDGKLFFGLPSNQNINIPLTYDKGLSDTIIDIILNNEDIERIGDPTVIRAMVFPSL